MLLKRNMSKFSDIHSGHCPIARQNAMYCTKILRFQCYAHFSKLQNIQVLCLLWWAPPTTEHNGQEIRNYKYGKWFSKVLHPLIMYKVHFFHFMKMWLLLQIFLKYSRTYVISFSSSISSIFRFSFCDSSDKALYCSW